MMRYNALYRKPKLLRRYNTAVTESIVLQLATNFPASQFIAGIAIAMEMASTAELDFSGPETEWII